VFISKWSTWRVYHYIIVSISEQPTHVSYQVGMVRCFVVRGYPNYYYYYYYYYSHP